MINVLSHFRSPACQWGAALCLVTLMVCAGCAAPAAPPLPTQPFNLPSAAQEATATPALSQNYHTTDGALTFDYPQGWQAAQSSDGLVALASSGLDPNSPGALGAGQFVLYIGGIPPENVTQLISQPALQGVIENDPPTAADLLRLLVTLLIASNEQWSLQGSIETLNLGMRPAALARLAYENTDGSLSSLVLEIDAGNGSFVTLRGLSHPDSLAGLEEQMTAIGKTISYKP